MFRHNTSRQTVAEAAAAAAQAGTPEAPVEDRGAAMATDAQPVVESNSINDDLSDGDSLAAREQDIQFADADDGTSSAGWARLAHLTGPGHRVPMPVTIHVGSGTGVLHELELRPTS